MWPVLLELGPIKIHSYGLMIAVGFLCAVFFAQRDAVKRGMNPKIFGDMAFYILPIGVLGARLAHIVMYPKWYSWDEPIGWIAVWRGGLVFQGALVPAALFVFWYLRKHGIKFMNAADIMFPYLALAHAFGRVGCFLYGCCYGRPTEVAWGIPARRVPWDTAEPAKGSPAYVDYLETLGVGRMHDAHWSHAIHPTQLYSVLGLLSICAILLLMRRYWNPFAGFTFPLYLVLYGAFRFVVEFYRGDHNPTTFGQVTQQQLYSVLFAAFGVALFFYFWKRSKTLEDQPSEQEFESTQS